MGSEAVNKDTSSAQLVALDELASPAQPGAPVLQGNLGLLHGVEVKLNVVVGEVHTTLGELMALGESSVLKVNRAVDAPVDVVVNSNVVARGQLVAVDDHFGVRITEIHAAPKA